MSSLLQIIENVKDQAEGASSQLDDLTVDMENATIESIDGSFYNSQMEVDSFEVDEYSMSIDGKSGIEDLLSESVSTLEGVAWCLENLTELIAMTRYFRKTSLNKTLIQNDVVTEACCEAINQILSNVHEADKAPVGEEVGQN